MSNTNYYKILQLQNCGVKSQNIGITVNYKLLQMPFTTCRASGAYYYPDPPQVPFYIAIMVNMVLIAEIEATL